jgi:hypothetical protein
VEGDPPRVFLRKDVILWGLCVRDVQECDSKGVIGLERRLSGDGGVGRRAVRGSTTHDSRDLMMCKYYYWLVLFEWGVRTGRSNTAGWICSDLNQGAQDAMVVRAWGAAVLRPYMTLQRVEWPT